MDRFDILFVRLAKATANMDFLKWAEITDRWISWFERNCPHLVDIASTDDL